MANCKKKPCMAIAALDMSAAFDTISIDALEGELYALGLAPSVVRWFKSYMANGRQIVQWNGSRSMATLRDRP